MITNKELEELVVGATKEEIHSLIIAGINETIKMSNKQIIKLLELQRGL
jgi:hypothetical protein